MTQSIDLRKPFHLSDEHWSRLSSADQELFAVVRPAPQAAYSVDIHLGGVEQFLADAKRDMERFGGVFELEPDFQRGHVWSECQQVAYIESLLRNRAPRTIQFNCKGWMGDEQSGDIPAYQFQCIDGLQRLTAVRRFLRDEFKVFDRYFASDLKGTPFDPKRIRLSIHVHEIAWRRDLLQYYLDFNSGGTVHSETELERVRSLLAAT